MIDEEFAKKRIENLTSEELWGVLRTGMAGYTERALELAAAELATRTDSRDGRLTGFPLPVNTAPSLAAQGLVGCEAIKICFSLMSAVFAFLVIHDRGGPMDFAGLSSVLKYLALAAVYCALAWLGMRHD